MMGKLSMAPANVGAEWRRIPAGRTGYLACSQARSRGLLSIGADGTVTRSRDAGRWREVGDVGDAPTASSSHAANFYVATRDGTIRISRDGGQTWTVRAEPPA